MKNILSLVLVFCCGLCAYGQAPQKFNYQAVARDASGDVIANQAISLRISVLDGSASGAVVYIETHTVTTTVFGLFTLEIGGGTAETGDFSTIEWGSDTKFLQVELDAAGGTNYVTMGTSQLLSVPYALYAGNGSKWSANADGIDYTSGNVGIGTASPIAKLNIQNNNPNLIDLKIDNAGAGGAQLSLNAANDKEYKLVSTASGNTNGNAGYFGIKDETDGQWRFIIDTNGNTGIGTTTPSNLLTLENNTTGLSSGRHQILLHNNSTDGGSFAALKATAGNLTTFTSVGHYSETYGNPRYANYGELVSDGAGVILKALSNEGIIRFETGNIGGEAAERMRIDKDGNVGIGTTTPSNLLSLETTSTGLSTNRDVLVSTNTSTDGGSWIGYRLFAGNSGTSLGVQHFSSSYGNTKYADFSQLIADGSGLNLGAWNTEGIIRFETGNDGNGNMFERMRIDKDGNLGIGTSTPTSKLFIEDNVDNGDGRNLVTFSNTSNSDASITTVRFAAGTSGIHTQIGQVAASYNLIPGVANYGFIENFGPGLILKNKSPEGVLRFQTGGEEVIDRMRIDKDGNVGIGTTTPKAKLEVADGDVYVNDPTKGIILKSPNGTCFRVTIDDAGEFVRTQITCPQ